MDNPAFFSLCFWILMGRSIVTYKWLMGNLNFDSSYKRDVTMLLNYKSLVIINKLT